MKSTLVLADPYTAFADGSAVVQNNVAGKVVMIGRAVVPSGKHKGKNGFSVKARAAQKAGAAAVIFVNNDEANPDTLINMISTGETVTIPVVMVSYNEGHRRLKNIDPRTMIEFAPGQYATRAFPEFRRYLRFEMESGILFHF